MNCSGWFLQIVVLITSLQIGLGRVNQHVILVDPATSLLARVPSNAPLARQPLMSAASEGA
jgi:hypothetical protein